MSSELPVLIIGAGPTGLMLAGELTRYGVKCRLIEKRAKPQDTSRAVAIQARTLEIFSYLGILDQFYPRGTVYHGMSAYNGKSRLAHITFDELDSPYPFILGVPQCETEDILIKRLAGMGLSPEWATEMTGFTQDDAGVTVGLKKADGTPETVRCRWVIGADGAHSPVRKGAGLTFLGETYESGFALADVRIDWALPHDEVLVFPGNGEHGLTAVFPLPGENRYRLTWEFEATHKIEAGAVAQHGRVTDVPEPTLADAQKILDERVAFPAKAHDGVWYANFRVNSRMAAAYRNGRVFLAGDAAHIHSPAGGQGMNTGLQDAFNLAWKLAFVENGAARPAILDSYHDERHAVGIDLLKNTDRMASVAMLRHPVAIAVRNNVMRVVSGFDVFQQRMRRTISELAIGYRKSPISAEYHGSMLGAILPHGADDPGLWAWREFANGPHAGDRAPDAMLGTGHLFDLFRDPKKFTLLAFAGKDAKPETVMHQKELLAKVEAEWGKLVKGVLIEPSEENAIDRYGARSACLYLVRPDGYIAYRSQPADLVKLNEYLRKWLA
ncbi:MAG: FAD-dependent monooxygenase [Gemmataceae bacterium]